MNPPSSGAATGAPPTRRHTSPVPAARVAGSQDTTALNAWLLSSADALSSCNRHVAGLRELALMTVEGPSVGEDLDAWARRVSAAREHVRHTRTSNDLALVEAARAAARAHQAQR